MLAKFVVGLDAATPPLAGLSGTSRLRFIAFDAIGAALWSGAYTGLGYAFGKDLDRAAAYVTRLGTLWMVVVFASLVMYVGRKLVRWHRFVRECRMARITPEELKEKLDAGEKILVVDLHGGRDSPRGHQAFPAQCASIRRGLDNAPITTGEDQCLVIARLSFTVLLPMSSRARV
jgi:hypothetical protein